jgi:hypothetical protein
MRQRIRRHGTSAAVIALALVFVVPVSTATPAAGAAKPTGTLSDVVCPTATTCFTVGAYGDAEHAFVQPLAGQWNGKTWRLTAVPTPSAAPSKSRGVLSGVACPTATRCFAVGNNDVGNGSGKRILIEQWNGKTWSITSRIRPAGSHTSQLDDVACFAAQRCFAVGSWDFERKTHAYIAQWNGKAWSSVTVPHIHGDEGEIKQSRLLSITCVRTTSCFAVGSYIDNRRTKALTVRFDGTRWRTVYGPTLEKKLTYTSLSAVSCVSNTICHGVGRYGDAAAYGGECCINAPRAMRWNGIRWLIVDSPSSTKAYDELTGDACPAADLCLAVGSARNWQTGKYHVLVERWNGTTWSVVDTGLDQVPGLTAIACRSRGSCVAVGGKGRPIVARMQGGSWSAASIPVNVPSA